MPTPTLTTRTIIAAGALLAASAPALAQGGAFPRFNSITLTRAPLAGGAMPSFVPRVTDSMFLTGSQLASVPSPGGFNVMLNHAVVWTIAGATQEVTLPPALGLVSGWPAEWRGVDVNESGRVLINYAYSNQPPRTFVRPPDGSAWIEYTVTNMPAMTRWTGQYLTDDNTVFGVAQNLAQGVAIAVRWTGTTTAVAIPLPASPAPASNPQQQLLWVSPSGWSLLQYQPAGGGLAVPYAVAPDNTVHHLFPLPAGFDRGGPSRINRGGVSIGSVNVLGVLPSHPVLWGTGGGITDLYDAGADYDIGTDGNDAGWTIGGSNFSTDQKVQIAGIGAASLPGLINAGQLPPGTQLMSVGGISNGGQILGMATGQPVLLTPDNTCPVVSLNPPASASLCNSGELTLTAGGYAALPVSYQWRRGSQPLPGKTGPTLHIAGGTGADNGVYDCVLSTTCGNAVTTPCTVTITFRCGPADIGGTGGVYAACGDGVLDNNDFVVFIDLFFNGSPLADRGRTGGLPGSDGAFDNNDFVVFIDQFFAGC